MKEVRGHSWLGGEAGPSEQTGEGRSSALLTGWRTCVPPGKVWAGAVTDYQACKDVSTVAQEGVWVLWETFNVYRRMELSGWDHNDSGHLVEAGKSLCLAARGLGRVGQLPTHRVICWPAHVLVVSATFICVAASQDV